MLHVINAWCAARGLDTMALRPLQRMCWRQFTVQWGDCRKSQIMPLNVIIIIIISIIIIIIISLKNKNHLVMENSCYL